MSRLLIVLSMVALMAPLALAQTAPTTAPATAPADISAGDIAPDFILPDLLNEGEHVSLSGLLADKDYVVVIWNSVTCPWFVPYDDYLPGVADEYADQGVAFVGINSNSTESDEQVISHLTDAGFNFPVLRDEGNVVADQYGAEVTPEVFVIDPDRVVRYHGRIDDSPRDHENIANPDLRNALDALLAGQEPPQTVTLARGCTIKRVGM